MHPLIDTIGKLTAERDRDRLETTLAGTLGSLLDCRALTLHALLRHPGEPARLLPRARWAGGAACSLPEPGDEDTLPGLAERPDWTRCVEERALLAVRHDDGGRRHLLPILGEHQVTGLVEVEGADDTRLRARLPEITGLLTIYRNHVALLDWGELDTLTGLRNRRTFDADFARLLDAAARPVCADGCGLAAGQGCPGWAEHERRRAHAARPHWMAVIDIDHFKRINDDYGHLYGDEVLLLMSRLLRAGFRLRDRLYRFGGEEFVVLLDRTPEDAVRGPLERLRETVAAHPFPRVGNVTVSIGCTRIELADTASSAFGRADAALYDAKRAGRDRVVIRLASEAPAMASAGEVELF